MLILGGDHSGFVDENSTIDHFIQVSGQSSARYDVGRLPPKSPDPSTKLGGFHENDTLREFLSRPFKPQGQRLFVWRCVAAE